MIRNVVLASVIVLLFSVLLCGAYASPSELTSMQRASLMPKIVTWTQIAPAQSQEAIQALDAHMLDARIVQSTENPDLKLLNLTAASMSDVLDADVHAVNVSVNVSVATPEASLQGIRPLSSGLTAQFVEPTDANNSTVKRMYEYYGYGYLVFNISVTNNSPINYTTLYLYNGTSAADLFFMGNTTANVLFYLLYVPYGTWYVNATVVDVTGVTNSTQTRKITVQSPQILFMSSTDKSGVALPRNKIWYNVTTNVDNFSGAVLGIYDENGTLVQSIVSAVNNFSGVSTALPDGNYSFNATVWDVEGAWTYLYRTPTRQLSIQAMPPVVTLTSPNNATGDKYMPVSITSNQEGNCTYTLSNGSETDIAFPNANTQWQPVWPYANTTEMYGLAMSADGKYETIISAGLPPLVSSNFGQTWAYQGPPIGGDAIDMSKDGRVQTILSYTGVWVSTNYGVSWTRTSATIVGDVVSRRVAVSANGSKQVIGTSSFNGSNSYIYESSDYGTTWNLVDAGARSWDGLQMSDDGKLQIASFMLSLYRSNDSGQSWAMVALAPTLSHAWRIEDISSDGNRMLLLGTNASSDGYPGVWISTDAGNSWRVRWPYPTLSVTSAAMTDDGQTITARTQDGIYVSSDAGLNWAKDVTWDSSVPMTASLSSSQDGSVRTAIWHTSPNIIDQGAAVWRSVKHVIANFSTTDNKQFTGSLNLSDGNYQMQVFCYNQAGVVNASVSLSFSLNPNASAPIQLAKQVAELTNESAVINVVTDKVANGSVAYGTNITAFDGLYNNQSFATTNLLYMNGLTPNTTYYYNLTYTSAGGNSSTYGPYNFTTRATIKVVVNTSEFNSNGTTDFSRIPFTNLSNISGVQFANNFGRIAYLVPISLNESKDVTNLIHIEAHKIMVNSSSLPEFNKSAQLVFTNVTFAHPIIKHDGTDCTSSRCTNSSFNASGQTLFVTVSGFSTYEVVDQCFDGVQNYGETGVDCGGVCGACAAAPAPSQSGGGGGGGGGGMTGLSPVSAPTTAKTEVQPDTNGSSVPRAVSRGVHAGEKSLPEASGSGPGIAKILNPLPGSGGAAIKWAAVILILAICASTAVVLILERKGK